MHFNLLNWLRVPKADDISRKQVEEAGRLYLDHSAAAEHHKALAEMYLARIERLTAVVAKGAR